MPEMLPSIPGVWPLRGRDEEIRACLGGLGSEDFRVVVLRGEAGTGKSRLAAEAARRFMGQSDSIEYVQATEATRAMPLGALMHMLPRFTAMDLGELFQLVRDEIQQRDSPLLILLDDVHLLDDTSAALLTPLLAAGVVRLLATVRSRTPVSASVEGLWLQQPSVVIELSDLEDLVCIEIVENALGGPVDRIAASEFAATSKGNPLYLRELILGSIASGALYNHAGVWRLEGSLRATDALIDLVTRRVEAIGADARAALEYLAVGDVVGVVDAERVCGGHLEALERAGLIRIEVGQRRFHVRIAHPLYGEVLRSGLSVLQRRAHCLAHSQRLTAYGARRRNDPLRIASLLLDGTGTASIPELVQAARLARHGHDYSMVQRLTRAALREGQDPMASVLLGEALYETGEFAEAEQVLAAAVAVTGGDAVAIASVRSVNLFWGLLQIEDAIEVALDAARKTRDDAGAGLWANVAAARVWKGEISVAMDLLGEHTHHDTKYSVAARALTLAPAQNARGLYKQAAATSSEGFAAHMLIDQPFAIAHPGNHMAAKVLALTNLGQFDEAESLGTYGYGVAVSQRVPIGEMWFALMTGRVALVRGDVVEAVGWLEKCVATARSAGQSIGEQLGLSGLVVCHALRGAVVQAQQLCRELDAGTIPWFQLYDADLSRARAWTAAADGRLTDARTIMLAAADRSQMRGIVDQEATALFDVFRLGGAVESSRRFIEVAGHCEGDLLATQQRYVAGVLESDATAVGMASAAFERIGAYLLACESTVQASTIAQGSGDSRLAAQLERRANELSERFDSSVMTPHLQRSMGVVPLTEREREVSMLVAMGKPSREIAEELHVSVRTVNNHLQNVFSKLGVSSRDEVAAALGIGRSGS